MAGGRNVRINWHEGALRELTVSPTGPVGRFMQQTGERVTQEAKRLAPVSPRGSNGRRSGYLRSQIGWTMGSDGRGVYVDIASPALSTGGAPYGLYQETGTSKMAAQPHLRPALAVVRR
ncbi:MAG: HK97 gp10 family phage protein [Chloroflexi bacterium]|nr:HK97 gp10 family phage protein [Chloroflexota bacterium]